MMMDQLLKERVRHGFVLALFAFTLYVVLANIALGQMTFELHPVIAYIVLAITLGFLFNVEGLEIAVTALYGVTLDRRTKKQFNTARNIHELTSAPKNLKNFLIGRQVFVIMLVFVLAGLTSSDQQFLPFTDIRLPDVVSLVIFKLGFLGALLTFWMGQISGKIMASQNPVKFLDFPLQAVIVRLALLIGSTGLAYPVEKLVRHESLATARADYLGCCGFSPEDRISRQDGRRVAFD